MPRNMTLKIKVAFSLILIILVSSCTSSTSVSEKEQEKKTFSVNIKNYGGIDSLVIYDKSESWKIMRSIHILDGNGITDLSEFRLKRYQLYLFSQGNQESFGELVIDSNSSLTLEFDERNLFQSIRFVGSYEECNNLLAYTFGIQKDLSEQIKIGLDTNYLDSLINSSISSITKQADVLEVEDSLKSYVSKQFLTFSQVLKTKNQKYCYKSSLIGSVGNKFGFKNEMGQNISLEDFKGKYLYLDVWATWCKPCKIEVDYLIDLDKYFSKNSKISILSISIDKDFDIWKTYIESKRSSVLQLYSGASSPFVNFYDIGSLPRFILIDPEGKIINSDEIRPSSQKIIQKLENIIQES